MALESISDTLEEKGLVDETTILVPSTHVNQWIHAGTMTFRADNIAINKLSYEKNFLSLQLILKIISYIFILRCSVVVAYTVAS